MNQISMNEYTLNIPDELIERISNHMTEACTKDAPEYYWNQGDELSVKQIVDAIEQAEEGKDGMSAMNILELEISDNNTDTEYHIRRDWVANELEENFEQELRDCVLVGDDEDSDDIDMDYKELVDGLHEHGIDDNVYVDLNIKQLLNSTGDIAIRIELLSNYDCINSAWLEGQSTWLAESTYFADAMQQMRVSPKEMKPYLTKANLNVGGRWPAKNPAKSIVSAGDMYAEHRETCCGANLFTIVGMVDAASLLENYHKGCKLRIPKGQPFGFFSSMQGGGSTFDHYTLRDTVIDLTKTWDRGYGHWRMVIDEAYRYSIHETYGTDSQFFGGEITIEK